MMKTLGEVKNVAPKQPRVRQELAYRRKKKNKPYVTATILLNAETGHRITDKNSTRFQQPCPILERIEINWSQIFRNYTMSHHAQRHGSSGR